MLGYEAEDTDCHEQAAGFLRIPASAIPDEKHGGEPLDCTAVHPESYDSCRALLR